MESSYTHSTVDGGWIRADDPRWGAPPTVDDPGRTGITGSYPEVTGPGPEISGPAPRFDDDPDRELAERFAALGHLTRVVADYVTPAEAPTLAAATELADRAASRLSLGEGAPHVGGHTVVALAGATGVGKSSLFNALARMSLSPSGHLRPTTGEAYACVWDTRGARHLLNWLGVAPRRRFLRESPLDAEDEAPLRGLVLLDLPDVDSIAAGNRIEADRLVGIVDRVIWVLDPQKYADQTVHDEYLRQMGALRDVTVVVFNQTDRLTPADADRCRADLARLVEADGLPGVPVIGTSTVTGEGIEEVRGLLEKVVADRLAVLARLQAELDEAVLALSPLAPRPGPDEQDVSREAVPELARGLAAASGADTLAVEAARAYRRQAGVVRLPWRRKPGFSPVPPADPAAVGRAVRGLAASLGDDLPAPWPQHLRVAATAELDKLPEELAGALSVARGPSPVTPVWTVVRAAWWLALALMVATLGIGLSTGEARPWLPLAGSGAVLAVAMPALAAATAAWRARHYRRAAARRLHLAALTVAREVVAPVRQVLRDYAAAHASVQAARSPR